MDDEGYKDLNEKIDLETLINILQEEENKWEYDELSLELLKRDTRKYKPLSFKEENNLFEKSKKFKYNQRDYQAIWDLVLANIRSVFIQARKYQNHGLLLNDLISEGIMGLYKAAEKFDGSRGFRFLSYGIHYIKSYISTAIDNYGNLIRISSNVVGIISKINKIRETYKREFGEEPPLEYIKENFDMGNHQLLEIMNFDFSYVNLDALYYYLNNEEKVDEVLHRHLIEIPDIQFYSSIQNEVIKKIDNEDLRIEIDESLNQLYDREREIIKMYFGLGYSEMSLDEIADRFDLTSERVRQIKDKAIKKLKGQKSKNLQQFLGR